MNKSTFIDVLEEPGKIGDLPIELLLKLKEEHPYSSTIQMLYTKALHAEKSIYYEDQLRNAALVVPDRRKFYQLILQTPLQEQIAQFEEEVAEFGSSTEEVAVETSVVVPGEVVEETEQEMIPEDESQSDTTEKEALDSLEQGILIEAINSSIHSEILEYEIEEQLEQEPISPLSEEDQKEETQSVQEETTVEVVAKSVVPKAYDFNTWLNPESVTPSKEVKERAEVGEIIDQFIGRKEETGIVQKDFFSAANLAKLSLVDKEDFVSETLAKIYADQGNYEKAIRAYEVLSLKFPEKSTFFANRIKNLKEKLEE